MDSLNIIQHMSEQQLIEIIGYNKYEELKSLAVDELSRRQKAVELKRHLEVV